MLKRNDTLDDALEKAERRYRQRNPKSAARFEEASKYMPGGNTRTVLHYSPFPLAITHAEGARVHDADGHGYSDFLNEFTAGLFGHSDHTIRSAVTEALAKGYAFGGPNMYEARLAALMCERFPSCDQVRMCNSGTEANINAIGLARAVTGREGVLVFKDAYHGGVLTFDGDRPSPLNVPFRWVFGDYNDVEGTRRLIEKRKGDLACIIVEPMMGNAGAIAGSGEFLSMLREETSKHGILLIFDEVMTSRLGPKGRQGEIGVIPDLTTFGKYIGGGMTFGAFGGAERFMSNFDPDRPNPLLHSGTYNNNVLSMAAGVAALEKVLTPNRVQDLNAKGDALRERLNEIAARRQVPLQVIGLGSIMCIHLHDRPINSPEDAKGSDPRARALFHLEMLERGLYLARRGFISLSLPLEQRDYDAFAEAFEDVIILMKPHLQAEAP
ncbi:MAG TPA: aspartate aminotransferase family protein [Kiloniellales bacterium]|nr:aspartate aminotransferase family protein [Kiloniellales bacterium]